MKILGKEIHKKHLFLVGAGAGLGLVFLYARKASAEPITEPLLPSGPGQKPPSKPGQKPPSGPGSSAGPVLLADIAKRLEQSLRSGKHDQGLIKQFQTAAGTTVDGDYGPSTAMALNHALGHAAPPTSRRQWSKALEELATQVEASLVKQKKNYDHSLVRNFQARAGGINVDGAYGVKTHDRLEEILKRSSIAMSHATAGYVIGCCI